MTTEQEVEKLKERIEELERTLKALAANVASLGGVLQLDSRVAQIEKKLGLSM